MKLTKLQQEAINRMITEDLNDVLLGRMEEADGEMENRVNDTVIADAIKSDGNLRAIAAEIFDEAAMKFEARLVKVIAQQLRANGIAQVSPNDVDDVLQRTHYGQYEEMGQFLRDKLVEVVAEHAADLAGLVASALTDEDVG